MTRPIRILELRSVRGTGGGPEKTILLGTARTDPSRFAITVCYIRDRRDDIFSVDANAATLPVDYVEVVESHSFDRRVWPQLRSLVRERHIDIVHSHDYKTNFLAWLLSKAEPVIPLSTVHGWTGHSRREQLLYYPMDKRLLRFFPHLIAVSTDVRDELVRHGAKRDRVTTILNGIDHRAFQRDRSREPDVRRALGFSTDAVMIGAVGRLEPQKRFDLLIDAMPAIRSQYSKALLVIVGDGSQMAPLRAQTERLGLANVCLFLGHRTDVVTLHHAFDLFVQSSDYEGTPNAVLEAMALETPIVATRAGGTEEVVRDGLEGRLVPLADRQALVDAVCSVLSDPRGAHQRAISARLRIESVLSFDARMKAVEKIYTTLVTAGIRRGPRREHAAA